VIIGSNAAGKSNFISILKFLKYIAEVGLLDAVSLQRGSSLEIESWYMVGPDLDYLSHLGIVRGEESTDNLTKEAFNRLIPHSMFRIEFLNELLEHYQIERGTLRNTSFRYFVERWIQ